MPTFRKKSVPIKIEPVTAARTIATQEGTQEIEPGHFLASGVRGEQYAFGQDVFDTYEPVEGRPGFYVKRADVIVEAMRIAHPIEIHRPGWKHEGKAGDWLISHPPDDQYICDAAVFAETYEPADALEENTKQA